MKVQDAAGHSVNALKACRICHKKNVAPCPCGYLRGRCAYCCPGEPPNDVADNPTLLRRWNRSAQRAIMMKRKMR